MHFYATGLKWLAVTLAWALLPPLAGLSAAPLGKEDRPPAEKGRRTLDQAVTAEITDQPLEEFLSYLADQVKLKIALDRAALAQVGIRTDLPVTIQVKDLPLRTALRLVLDPYNLGYVRVGDTLLVTTEEAAVRWQMRQRIHLNLDEVPLPDALKQLARGTGANLVLDPRATKDAKATPISMELEDVPLETAVRLLAEVAGLKSVRIGNVLLVTTEVRADKLRAEPESSTPVGPGGSVPRYGTWQAAPPLPVAPPAPPPTSTPVAPPVPAAPANSVAVPFPSPTR